MRTALLGGALAVASLAGVAVAVAPDTASFRAGQASYGGTAVVTDLPAYGARGTDVVDYRHGANVTIRVPLTGTGRLPVRITGADLGGQRLALLTVTGGNAPLDLAAGATKVLELRGVLGNCRYYHEREVSTYDAIRLRFEVLGQTAERAVPLARPVVVHSPMIVGCPDRKLNRQADNRTD